jgi:hypothetical protein
MWVSSRFTQDLRAAGVRTLIRGMGAYDELLEIASEDMWLNLESRNGFYLGRIL